MKMIPNLLGGFEVAEHGYRNRVSLRGSDAQGKWYPKFVTRGVFGVAEHEYQSKGFGA